MPSPNVLTEYILYVDNVGSSGTCSDSSDCQSDSDPGFCNFDNIDVGFCELCSDIDGGCENSGFASKEGEEECKKICEGNSLLLSIYNIKTVSHNISIVFQYSVACLLLIFLVLVLDYNAFNGFWMVQPGNAMVKTSINSDWTLELHFVNEDGSIQEIAHMYSVDTTSSTITAESSSAITGTYNSDLYVIWNNGFTWTKQGL